MNKLNLLKNFSKKHYSSFPFPHFEIRKALDDDIYSRLEEEYLIIINYIKENNNFFKNNIRYQINSRTILSNEIFKKSIWYDFVNFHTSLEFYEDLLNIFNKDIKKIYPSLKPDINKKLLSIRHDNVNNNKKTNFVIDCQPGINTPTTTISSVRGPHVDNPVELIGGLFYLKYPKDAAKGGDLNLYEIEKNIFFQGKAEVENEKDLKLFKIIKYDKNKCVFFINSNKSIHSVTAREKSQYTRNLVNIVVENYNLNNGFFVLKRKKNTLKNLLIQLKIL